MMDRTVLMLYIIFVPPPPHRLLDGCACLTMWCCPAFVLLIYLLYLPPPPLPQVGGRLRVLAEEQPLLLTWLKEEQGTSQRLAVRLRAASEDPAVKEREMQVCGMQKGGGDCSPHPLSGCLLTCFRAPTY